MDKSLAMVILRDLETSLNIIDYAVAEKNAILAQEALANAKLEVATLRQMFEEPPAQRRHTFTS